MAEIERSITFKMIDSNKYVLIEKHAHEFAYSNEVPVFVWFHRWERCRLKRVAKLRSYFWGSFL